MDPRVASVDLPHSLLLSVWMFSHEFEITRLEYLCIDKLWPKYSTPIDELLVSWKYSKMFHSRGLERSLANHLFMRRSEVFELSKKSLNVQDEELFRLLLGLKKEGGKLSTLKKSG